MIDSELSLVAKIIKAQRATGTPQPMGLREDELITHLPSVTVLCSLILSSSLSSLRKFRALPPAVNQALEMVLFEAHSDIVIRLRFNLLE